MVVPRTRIESVSAFFTFTFTPTLPYTHTLRTLTLTPDTRHPATINTRTLPCQISHTPTHTYKSVEQRFFPIHGFYLHDLFLLLLLTWLHFYNTQNFSKNSNQNQNQNQCQYQFIPLIPFNYYPSVNSQPPTHPPTILHTLHKR